MCFETTEFLWESIFYYRVNWWNKCGAHTMTFVDGIARQAFIQLLANEK